MTVTSNTVVNAAIQYIGDNQPPITGEAPDFDDSAAGVAAAAVYARVVQTVGRQFGWDFARNTVALAPTGNAAPFPWSQEYLYPSMGVQVRQIAPPALSDPNNPLPVNWAVANDAVGADIAKVILTNEENALAIFSNQPPEATWDPLFMEAVIRLLASELAMALEGRPDTARDMLESGAQFEKIGETRDS